MIVGEEQESRQDLETRDARDGPSEPQDDDQPASTVRRTREKLTDVGNTKRLVKLHGHDLRFVPQWKTWLTWDGKRWLADSTDEIRRRAMITVRSLYAEAERIDDDELRRRLVDHARESESVGRINAMVTLARAAASVVVEPKELDQDFWLLNCANGTLNLGTGQLRPHRRADLITKLAPVHYDRDAHDERLETFLRRVQPHDEQRAFLQRAAGYTLTGDTREEVLFFPQGGTSTGKSTFIEAMRAMMGDYAKNTPFDTFLRRNNQGTGRNDIARLVGARLVTAVEVSSGQHFDEALLKQLTGRDTVSARYLYGEFFDFQPQSKIWIAANHRPRVQGDDRAIWRRLILIPFTVEIPEGEQDKLLKTHLCTSPQARSAFLAWAVQGCLAWQEDGLRIPASVKAATEEYRQEMDTFGLFLDEDFMQGPDLWVRFAELRMAYDAWGQHYGERYLLGQRGLTEKLRERGFTPVKRQGVRGWQGLALLGKTVRVDSSDSLDSSLGKSS